MCGAVSARPAAQAPWPAPHYLGWSPIHRGQPLKDLLARGAAKRIHLEQLPGYAPDLNPVEGIWNSLQCRELGNVCCSTFAELDTALRRAKERWRHKRQVIRSSIAECGYRF